MQQRKRAGTFEENRHVLVVEASMRQEDKVQLFSLAEKIRKAGNELTGIMKKRLEQLVRTKRWRNLRRLYGKASKKSDERKDYARQLEQMQKDFHVTWEDCRTAMIPIGKKYGLHSVFALTEAEDVYRGVEKVLFGNGKRLHFAQRGQLPGIRAKQPNRAIIVNNRNETLTVKVGKTRVAPFGILIKDRFQCEEINRVLRSLEEEKPEGSHRPCYATIVCREIRGRLRVFVHITLTGKALPKYDGQGKLRHHLGHGQVGCDIGTQTAAWNSDRETDLRNLAQRGKSQEAEEKKALRLQRAIDRSLREMNPQNFNEDGTPKRGKKKWKISRRCRRLKARYRDICRRLALSRRYAVRELANHLRTLGDVLITEPRNSAKLMKRAKKTTYRKDGRPNRKKRFGASIRKRCPGAFQEALRQKFEGTGGRYIEVPPDYRASQYDHTGGIYVKKPLSSRMFHLSSGARVQRDMYSAFLLSCARLEEDGGCSLDQEEMESDFTAYLFRQNRRIRLIREKGEHILNSGIR